jgi:hypothetical protein
LNQRVKEREAPSTSTQLFAPISVSAYAPCTQLANKRTPSTAAQLLQFKAAPLPAEETLVSELADAFFLFALCTLLALLPLRSAHTSMSMLASALAGETFFERSATVWQFSESTTL